MENLIIETENNIDIQFLLNTPLINLTMDFWNDTQEADSIKQKGGIISLKLIEMARNLGDNDSFWNTFIITGFTMSPIISTHNLGDFSEQFINNKDGKRNEEFPKNLFFIGWTHYADQEVFLDEKFPDGKFLIVKTLHYNPLKQISAVLNVTDSIGVFIKK